MTTTKQFSNKPKNPIIGIIGGTGGLGQWFKIFFEKNGVEVLVSGRKTELTGVELAKKADIVIVSVPIDATVEQIKAIRAHVRRDALLADFTSVKTGPLKEMAKAKSGVLGMHPLFGPMVPDLKNQTIAFCRHKDNQWVEWLKVFFQKNGANVVETSAREHDTQMAFIQGMVQFGNIAYSHLFTLKKFKPLDKFLTPTFKLQSLVLGRILCQDGRLWAAIEMENPYFLKLAEDYQKEVARLVKIIKKGDYKNFEKNFQQTQKFFAGFADTAREKTPEVLKVMDRNFANVGAKEKDEFKKDGVGFLGPIGTFSWKAASRIFDGRAPLIPLATIREVFDLLKNGVIKFGVVPIENGIEGLVSETVNSFVNNSDIAAVGSFKLPIHHCLAARMEDINKIKIIKSHPQALAQCRGWLDKNLPGVVREASASTVAPIDEDFSEHTGFILSADVAKKFGLNVLADNIEDVKDNSTRFFVIAKLESGEPYFFPPSAYARCCEPASLAPSRSLPASLREVLQAGERVPKNKSLPIQDSLQCDHTLLLLSVYDKVGVLRDILDIFAKDGINLSAIHSIPSRSKTWDYMFFMELERKFSPAELAELQNKLQQYCSSVRVIGEV